MVFDITVKAETAACRIMVKRTPKFASEDPFGHISCATNELMQFLFTGKQGHHGSLASKVPSFQSETKTHCQELIKMMNKQQISLKQPFNTVQRQTRQPPNSWFWTNGDCILSSPRPDLVGGGVVSTSVI